MPLSRRVIACHALLLLPLFALFPAVRPAAAWDSLVGQESCAFVVSQMQSEEEPATLIIAAFITGVNYATGRTVDAEVEEMVSRTRDFCERQPSARFLEALIGLDEELDARKAAAEQVETETEEQPAPAEGAGQ